MIYEATAKKNGSIFHVRGTMRESGITGPYVLKTFMVGGAPTTNTQPSIHSLGHFSSEQYEFRTLSRKSLL